MKISFTIGLMMTMMFSVYSQEEVVERNQEIFADFMYQPGNEYRTASGKPGPKYWQNSADYKLDVHLDPSAHSINGHVDIYYTNNSPEELEFIWLILEQNRFTPDSKGTLTTPVMGNRYTGDVNGGYQLSNVKVVDDNKTTSTDYSISDTRMKINLKDAIPANGGKATISMDFSFTIPQKGMDRMGRMTVEDGEIYALAQWYPKVAVFDDIQGWNIEPYLGAGEFYLEYGDFDCYITAPYDQIVVASGKLMNPKKVLSKTLLDRWEKAAKSDTTVFLIAPDEIKNYDLTRPKTSGTFTWHYQILNARDFAFASSNAFIWDAAKMDLGNNLYGMAQSVYPKESQGSDGWGRSTEYTKKSIEHYSNKWYTYPYPTAINVACHVGGMEYPGVSFCRFQAKNRSLWGVTDHEFGHNWFPMIVGSNERKYAWMDEGFNTFINYYSTLDFNDGEYSATLNRTRQFTSWFNNNSREPIATYPDVVQVSNLGMIGYRKPGMGLLLLREYILGPERFDEAFKAYIERWAYKHPTPNDFFNTINNVAGENLSWFWRTWFYGNGNIDLSIQSVNPYKGNYIIQLGNLGEIPMPVLLKITYEDDSEDTVKLPVEIWQRGNQWNYLHETDKKIKSVELDPNKLLPDVNGSNDIWPLQYYKK
ncbi:M1 family metallopeptidase [Membranihabitans marinus]